MLKNLKAEMTRRDVKAKQIAEALDVRLATVYDKLNGKYPFTFTEAVIIKKSFFPDEDIEYLFRNFEEVNSPSREVI